MKMLDFYIARLPSNPKAFYLRPAASVPEDPMKPWYINVPVGINKFRNFLPSMSVEAELITRYTNHCLRATSASRLFAKNVPEKLIKEKTGHRSLDALRVYERTTSVQERQVTKLLVSKESS